MNIIIPPVFFPKTDSTVELIDKQGNSSATNRLQIIAINAFLINELFLQ